MRRATSLLCVAVLLGTGLVTTAALAYREKNREEYPVRGPVRSFSRSRVEMEQRFGRIREKGETRLLLRVDFSRDGRILEKWEKKRDFFILNITYSYSNERISEAVWLTEAGDTNRIVHYGYSNTLLVRERHTDISNTLVRRYQFQYNDQKRIRSLRGFNKDGSLFVRSRYRYDKKGRLLQQEEYGPGNKYLGKTVWTYTTNDRVSSRVSYDAEGARDMLFRYVYNEKNCPVEESLYKANGELLASYVYRYRQYDNHTNWRVRMRYKKQGDGDTGSLVPQYTEYQMVKYFQ